MYESIKSSLASWSNTTTDREKLQHLYATSALALLIVAGVIGLLNQALGQQILAVAIAATGVFLVNAVAWALLQSFVLFRIPKHPRSQPTLKSAKKSPISRKK